MEVRRAIFQDMADIITYMEEYHIESSLKDVPFDRQSVAKIVKYLIQTRDSLPLVAIGSDNKLAGLLFGTLEPYFFNKKRCYGTDLLFIGKGGGTQLWRKFKTWAFNQGADRIIMAVSSGDPRADQLLGALGMESTGGMYVLRNESS